MLSAARDRFAKLGMHKTTHRNAVLLYFAPASQQFALWGDISVHEKCGDNFWKSIASRMVPFLKEQKYTEAVEFAVQEVGNVRRSAFPQGTRRYKRTARSDRAGINPIPYSPEQHEHLFHGRS